MKKAIAIILMMLIAVSAIPAFAQSGGSKMTSSKPAEKTLFQIANDSLEEIKPPGQGSKEITVFESAKKNLGTLDGASQRAKQLSLRDNKAELCKRMANPFAN